MITHPHYPHYPHTLTTLTEEEEEVEGWTISPHLKQRVGRLWPGCGGERMASWNLLQTVACLPLIRLAHRKSTLTQRKSTWTLHHLSSCLMKPHIALDAWEAKAKLARNLRQWLSRQAGNVHMAMYTRYFLTMGKVLPTNSFNSRVQR